MLPGFRFLFAAIALSMSILVFGLGAAALLRAAHEEFASLPSRRAAPEAVFAAPGEGTSPVLAMLRIEPQAEEPKAADNVLAARAPVGPAEQAAIVSSPVEPEKMAALKPEEPSSPEAAKASPETGSTEIPVAESPSRDKAAEPASADGAVLTGETKIAANEPIVSPSNEIVLPTPEPMSAPASPNIAPTKPATTATKIATLGGPPVITDAQPSAKVSAAKPDKDAIKKRVQARQAAQRRRIARRARVVQQAPQQPTDPFAQPVATAPKR
jgi:hypothetical protein